MSHLLLRPLPKVSAKTALLNLILLFKSFEKGFEHVDEEMNMILKALLNVLMENLNSSFD
jgi:hypothetical protein